MKRQMNILIMPRLFRFTSNKFFLKYFIKILVLMLLPCLASSPALPSPFYFTLSTFGNELQHTTLVVNNITHLFHVKIYGNTSSFYINLQIHLHSAWPWPTWLPCTGALHTRLHLELSNIMRMTVLPPFYKYIKVNIIYLENILH